VNLASASPIKKAKTQKVGKNKRKEMINKEDELTGAEVLEYLAAFKECQGEVGNPKDEIKAIFDKV